MTFDNRSKPAAWKELKDYFTTDSQRLNALWKLVTSNIGKTVFTPDELAKACNSHRYGAFLDTLKRNTPLRWEIERVETRLYYKFYFEVEEIPA